MVKYIKTVPIEAEQFDGTLSMANDYGLVPDLDQPDQYLEMWHDDECCDRDVTVKQGDWLVKADVPVNVGLPEYQVYSDEAFHRTFRRCSIMKIVSINDLKKLGINVNDNDLRGADLRFANLRDAKLNGVDLSNANLSEADLRKADLSDVDLSDADLRFADLRYANLSGANLSGADFTGAGLNGVILDNAKLIDTLF